VLFRKTYGLINSPKHFSFKSELVTGSLYWPWGIDHDAAEGYEVALMRGRYRLTLAKADNPAPAGARSVDAILITSDLSPLSAPQYPRYPLLDELRRANHLYFRFQNLSDQRAKIIWNHNGHRYPDFYNASYRDLVRFYHEGDAAHPLRDADGRVLQTKGDWPDPLEPGEKSVWYDLGPTMNTESPATFLVRALPVNDKGQADPKAASLPVEVAVATAPDENTVVSAFQLAPGETELDFLLQPDLYRPEGRQYSKKTVDIYREITEQLDAEPRLGPIPKKLKLFASTDSPRPAQKVADLAITEGFRHALGLNTFEANLFDKEYLDAATKWWSAHGGIIARSVSLQHSQDVPATIERVRKAGIEPYFYDLCYGDEIGLPVTDARDAAQVKAFQEFLREQHQTPQTLGLPDWEHVKPLGTFSVAQAVSRGVLPQGAANTPATLQKLKPLYWFSVRFRNREAIAGFAAKTRDLKAALGSEVETTANLGGMHPFYWMPQTTFVDAFQGNAMSLAWSEDYTYMMPEASRLLEDFEAAYLRKGASYHDQRMMFYCMPHWPGNTPDRLVQNAVMLWGQNVKDLDFFSAAPDVWTTENYIAYRGGLPMWKAIRTISGMAGLIEDDLLPARPASTPVAMLLSESSDLWEMGGAPTQFDIAPGKAISNVSQEERKNLWYALRKAGYRVDLVTEDDVKNDLLQNYKALYVCGQNLERTAAEDVKAWVQNGGVLYATAGAARKDEFDAPLAVLDGVLGRGAQQSYEHYRGPLRAKLELLFQKPLDTVSSGKGSFGALCSKETFAPATGAEVLARYKSDSGPAFVKAKDGKGFGYYAGILPGETYIRKFPPVPMGKGGDEGNFGHYEPTEYNPVALDCILAPLRENEILPDTEIKRDNVVASRLVGPSSTVLTVANLAEGTEGELKDIEIVLHDLPKVPQKVWSCYYPKGVPFRQTGDTLTFTLPTLAAADVVVIS
jgi:hypothetical protein